MNSVRYRLDKKTGDMMGTLYIDGKEIKTFNVDHVVYEFLYKNRWIE